HHVAFVVSSAAAALYVDGAIRDSRGWDGSPKSATTTQELRLGSYPGSGFYNGLIDEVTIWTRSLTTVEIQANRLHSLVGNEFGLQAYYRINEGTGTLAANANLRISLHQGTLVNGPLWVAGVRLAPGVSTGQP